MRRFFVVLVLLLAVEPAIAQEYGREELLAEPQFEEEAMEPAFVRLAAAEVTGQISVVSARNFAVFGFNTPEVRICLPDLDNSVYAVIETPDPLIDGKTLFQMEQGGLDARSRVASIRFLAPDDLGPVEFARVTGTARVHYPLEIETRTVAEGEADQLVSIDGPFVEFRRGTVAVAPSFSFLEPVRAFDREGRRLKKAPVSRSRSEAGVEYDGLAFHGAVAKVTVDTVRRWGNYDITYDLPPAPQLPPEQAGLTPDSLRPAAATPGGRVTVRLAQEEAGQAGEKPAETVPTPPPAAEVQEEPVAITSPSELSAEGRQIGECIAGLRKKISPHPAIVQLLAFAQGMTTIMVESTGGNVVSYSCNHGKVRGPEPVDTRYMDCTAGLPQEAVDLDRLPYLWDDAAQRSGDARAKVLQLIVAQSPCGTAFLIVPVDGRSGLRRVRYSGEGRFLSIE